MIEKLYVPTSAECKLVTIYDNPIRAFIKHNSDGMTAWADGPDDADVIVLFEEWGSRFSEYIDTLRNDPFLAAHWRKVVTVNCDDLGRGFLPGLYTSLNRNNFDSRIHRACAYPYTYNSQVAGADRRELTRPKWLFSFRGTDASHPVRRRLFRAFATYPNARMELVRTSFHSHAAEQKQAYVDDILDSMFGLCPRGWSPSTYRLFEVMELGRCPVIISDDWIPIAGVPWDECSIRIAEADADRLGLILERRKGDAEGLGTRARQVWEEHFSDEAKFRAMARAIMDLKQSWRGEEFDYRGRWSTWRFYSANGWLLHQRLSSRLSRLRS